MNKIKYDQSQSSPPQAGDLYIYPKDPSTIYVLASYNGKYMAINLSTGSTWYGNWGEVDKAVYGLEFYKRKATISIE